MCARENLLEKWTLNGQRILPKNQNKCDNKKQYLTKAVND